MVKVVSPLHSSEARGRLGEMVYNTWRGIRVVRSRPASTTQNTPAQLAARAVSASLTAAWQALTGDQRTLWEIYAAGHPETDWTGTPRRLTGYNLFMRLGHNMNACGVSPLSIPPIGTAPNEPVLNYCTYVQETGDIIISYVMDGTLEQWYFDVWYYGPHPTTRAIPINYATRLMAVPTYMMAAWLQAAETDTVTFWARMIDSYTGLTSQWVKTIYEGGA